MNITNEIIENIKKKKFEEALKICERIENSSNKEVILNFKGIIYFNKGQKDLAEKNNTTQCNTFLCLKLYRII